MLVCTDPMTQFNRMIAAAAAVLAPLALSACATPGDAPSARDYVAGFNEPFMSFTSDGNRLVLTTPDNMDGRTLRVERTALVAGVQFDGMLDRSAPDSRFRLTVTRQYCEDDMAGLPYSHHAMLERGENLQYRPHMGCARLTTEPQPREQ